MRDRPAYTLDIYAVEKYEKFQEFIRMRGMVPLITKPMKHVNPWESLRKALINEALGNR